MNDQWLRSFILSAECGSFSKAAKASFISTTALIQQINLFEKEIGFDVFYRNNIGIELTSAGEAFLHTSKEVLKTYDEGRKRAYEISKNTKSSIRFAFEPYQFPNKWLTILNDFCDYEQKIKIHMLPINMNQQINAILKNDADVCILAEPQEESLGELRYLNLYEDTYSFCMGKKHPLARKRILTLEDVKEYTLMCGNYPYMKQSFKDGLKGVEHIKYMDTEYDMTTRLATPSNNLFVIHSAWKDQYTVFFSVVKTNISAGNVGFVYYKKYEQTVKALRDFMMQEKYQNAFK